MKTNENDLKILLLEHLLSDSLSKADVVASEVPYLSGQRRVDLLTVSRQGMHAYEVKSDCDSLQRLEGQLEDYLSTFEYTTIVTSSRYERKLRKNLSKYVGIMVFDSITGDLCYHRQALQRKKLRKDNVVRFLWMNDVHYAFRTYTDKKTSRTLQAHEARKKLVLELNLEALVQSARDSLYRRYEERYRNFINELGEKINSADLRNLTYHAPVIVY